MNKKSISPGSSSSAAFLFTLLLSMLFACQQVDTPKKHFLIGVINPNTGTREINMGFISELQESGFIEDENTTYIRHDSNFEIDEVIKDLVTRKADLIFTVTTPATLRAQKAAAGKSIPVVFAMQDPVASGIIPSLANPSGNITGVQIRGSVPKAVEWMLAVQPELKHLFVPIKYDTMAAKQSLEDLKSAAASLGMKLTLAEVNNQSELEATLAAIPGDVGGLFILHSIFINSNTPKLVQTAVDRRILIGAAAANSDQGVTISYGMIPEKTGRQAGRMAKHILLGRKAADIPAEVADFFIGVNLQTAEASQIQIPLDILQQADIIIR